MARGGAPPGPREGPSLPPFIAGASLLDSHDRLQASRNAGPGLGEETRHVPVLIDGYDLPGLTCRPDPSGSGHRNVHVALSGKVRDRPALVVPDRPGLAIEPVPGDAESARWELQITVRRDADGFDFSGPFVGGTRDDRNLGLAWGDVPGDGTLRLFAVPSSGSWTWIPL